MRLLHVSDWHLGRHTGKYDRRADHAEIIEQTVRHARDHDVDLILHTGDLFDRPQPALEDARMGTDALRRLAEIAPTVVICGNHDSAAMFRWLGSMIGSDRLRFVDEALEPDRGGILTYEIGGERARVACLPFISANRMVRAFEDPATWTVNYADRVRRIETALGAGLERGYDPARDVLLFAAHLHVTGARITQSERTLHVSDAYASHLEALPPVAYAAFGHIHRPQRLPGTGQAGWYAGSPIALDFGEEGQEKRCLLVDVRPGRPAEVTELPYASSRPLVRLRGTLDELAEQCARVTRGICEVTVVSEEPIEQLGDRVAELLPGADIHEVIEDCAARRTDVLTASAGNGEERVVPTLGESLAEYLATSGQLTRTTTAAEALKTFEVLLDAAQVGEAPHLPALAEDEVGAPA